MQREQEKQTKERRASANELDALKKLMGEKKYLEVISRAEELFAEFPSEPNLLRLHEFATGRQQNIEKELTVQPEA